MPQTSPAWLRAILNRRMVVCVFTGFASGMPLYLLFSLLPAWLKTEGLSLKAIGAFALIQFPYTWKFLWAPLLDRYALPWLGHRRGWMALFQLLLLGIIAWLGQLSPRDNLELVVLLTAMLAFVSASLDIVLDAFRRNLLADAEQEMGNTLHVNAYKIASLVPGSLALILYAHMRSWPSVFLITALFMLPGIVMTLLVSEPRAEIKPPKTLQAAIVEPFLEFFHRHGTRFALFTLLFILLYKLGDSLCTALATPFYMEMGFTLTEIGLVAKNAGLWPSIIGGVLGGLLMTRIGVNRALWVFGGLQAIAILGFAGLAWLGPPYVKPLEITKSSNPIVARMTSELVQREADHKQLLNRLGTLDEQILELLRQRRFVQAAADHFLSHVCTHKEALEGNPRKLRALINNSAQKYFNFSRMAQLATGINWESYPENQKGKQQRLTDAFYTVFVNTHIDSVIQYCNWTVEIDSSHVIPNTITTTMRHDGQTVSVAYSLEKAGETWKVFDITIDGQSLMESSRKVLASKLDTDGIDGLIHWLEDQIKPDFWLLAALAGVIGFEALGIGLGTAASVSFIARMTHPLYVATQFALLTSLSAIPRTFVNASAGWLVEGMGGWFNFFWLCFALAIPGMLLLFRVAPWNGSPPSVSVGTDLKKR